MNENKPIVEIVKAQIIKDNSSSFIIQIFRFQHHSRVH